MSGTRMILRVNELNAGYTWGDNLVHAVNDVSFEVEKGEFLGIAGESGCGKSTLAFSITGLLRPPGHIFSGSVFFMGKDLANLSKEEIRRLRWKDFSIVFQSSMNVLNPVLRIKDQIFDGITAHVNVDKEELLAHTKKLFKLVNVSSEFLDAYPHQLSGGMKQRIVIASALSLNPKLVIMDEPTTALDVVVQRIILQEIDELRRKLGFSIIFITHDLSLLVEISDTLAIMYAGRVVEKAPSAELYAKPMHPYTEGLMNSFPPLSGKRKRLHGIPGHPPKLSEEIKGCPFATRCPKKMPICENISPPYIEVEKGHFVACHLYK